MTHLIEGARHLRVPITSGFLILFAIWVSLEGELPDSLLIDALTGLGSSARLAVATVGASLAGHSVSDFLERRMFFRNGIDPSLDGNDTMFAHRSKYMAERILTREKSDLVQRGIAEKVLRQVERVESDYRFRIILASHLPVVSLLLCWRDETSLAVVALVIGSLAAYQAIRIVRKPLVGAADLISEIDRASASEETIAAIETRLDVLHLRIGSRSEEAVAAFNALIGGLSKTQRQSLSQLDSHMLSALIGSGSPKAEFAHIRTKISKHFDFEESPEAPD